MSALVLAVQFVTLAAVALFAVAVFHLVEDATERLREWRLRRRFRGWR